MANRKPSEVHAAEPWTPRHGAWCRFLESLGILDPMHVMCARAKPEDVNHAPHAKVGVNNGKG